MSEDREQDATFNEDQQQMFGVAEENQAADATRPRTPGTAIPPEPDVNFQPPTNSDFAQAGEQQPPAPLPHLAATRAADDADITGGTDKPGIGGLADSNSPANPTDAGQH